MPVQLLVFVSTTCQPIIPAELGLLIFITSMVVLWAALLSRCPPIVQHLEQPSGHNPSLVVTALKS